jgi:hypothetical protein
MLGGIARGAREQTIDVVVMRWAALDRLKVVIAHRGIRAVVHHIVVDRKARSPVVNVYDADCGSTDVMKVIARICSVTPRAN